MMVPLYKQELSWSCFATCVKMILEYYGVKKSEKELRLLFKTTPTYGTLWEFVELEIKRIGFELIWKKFWTLDEVNSLLKQSIPVIAGIKSETEDNHVIVLADLSEKYADMADPEKGNW